MTTNHICPVCNGPQKWIGCLANRDTYRCQDCGVDLSIPVQDNRTWIWVGFVDHGDGHNLYAGKDEESVLRQICAWVIENWQQDSMELDPEAKAVIEVHEYDAYLMSLTDVQFVLESYFYENEMDFWRSPEKLEIK